MNAKLLLIVVLASGTVNSLGQLSKEENTARLKQIDRSGDAVLQSDEVDLGFLYRATGGKLDLKHLPTATDVERDATNNAVFLLLRSEFDQDHGKKAAYSFDEVKADVDFRLPKPSGGGSKPPPADGKPPGPADEKPPVPPGRWLLRRSLEKIPATLADTDESADAMSKGPDKLAEQGALFSYGEHLPTGASEWIAEGALAYEKPFVGGLFGPTSLGRWLFSMGFSRIDFGGSGSPKKTSPRFKDESNLLTPGISYEALVNWPMNVAGFKGSAVRLSALWKTDFDFQSHIPTAELDWTFFNGTLGLGSFNMALSNLWWRIDAGFHGDVGYVASDGEWTKTTQGDTFVHLGPKIGLTLIPLQQVRFLRDNPLVINASFAQYEALTRSSKEMRAATVEAAWLIRKPGSPLIGSIDPGIALTISFRSYDDLENQQTDNSLILGISVGF